jgi:hypothetical protein
LLEQAPLAGSCRRLPPGGFRGQPAGFLAAVRGGDFNADPDGDPDFAGPATVGTVRKAIAVLVDEGLVYTVPGKGSFVTKR